jgi:hypothetical protein
MPKLQSHQITDVIIHDSIFLAKSQGFCMDGGSLFF